MIHRDSTRLTGHPPMVASSPKETSKGKWRAWGMVTEIEWTGQAVFRQSQLPKELEGELSWERCSCGNISLICLRTNSKAKVTVDSVSRRFPG